MRRYPLYFLVDTSGSMRGELINLVNAGLEALITHLRRDPYAIETVWISIITFDREVKCVLPLSPLCDIEIPRLTTPDSGPTQTNLALKLLIERVCAEINYSNSATSTKDRNPYLFLITDGRPSSQADYISMVDKVKKLNWTGITALGITPKANQSFLKYLTNDVYLFDSDIPTSVDAFFENEVPKLIWVWIDAPISKV